MERNKGAKMYPEVVCIGASCVDITLTGVVRRELFGDTYGLAEDVTYCVGGDAMNEAVTLAKLGRKVAYMGRVGADFTGEFIMREGLRHGIDMNCVTKDPGCQTYNPIAIVEGNDKRYFYWRKEGTSNKKACIDDVDLELVKKAKVVSFGSIFVVPGFTEEMMQTIFLAARNGGATVFVDVCPGEGGESLDQVKRALPYVDYFFLNLDEAVLLTGGASMDEAADILLDLGIGTVVTKLGKNGCYIKNRSGERRVPAYMVKAVNSTGAGDNFLAGFISAFLDGRDDGECARYGAATAALTVLSRGASTGVSDRAQVDEFIRTHRGTAV